MVSEKTIVKDKVSKKQHNKVEVRNLTKSFGSLLVLDDIRITSYNVCYTKLLRSRSWQINNIFLFNPSRTISQ